MEKRPQSLHRNDSGATGELSKMPTRLSRWRGSALCTRGIGAGLQALGRRGLLMLYEGKMNGKHLFPAEVVKQIRAGGDQKSLVAGTQQYSMVATPASGGSSIMIMVLSQRIMFTGKRSILTLQQRWLSSVLHHILMPRML